MPDTIDAATFEAMWAQAALDMAAHPGLVDDGTGPTTVPQLGAVPSGTPLSYFDEFFSVGTPVYHEDSDLEFTYTESGTVLRRHFVFDWDHYRWDSEVIEAPAYQFNWAVPDGKGSLVYLTGPQITQRYRFEAFYNSPEGQVNPNATVRMVVRGTAGYLVGKSVVFALPVKLNVKSGESRMAIAENIVDGYLMTAVESGYQTPLAVLSTPNVLIMGGPFIAGDSRPPLYTIVGYNHPQLFRVGTSSSSRWALCAQQVAGLSWDLFFNTDGGRNWTKDSTMWDASYLAVTAETDRFGRIITAALGGNSESGYGVFFKYQTEDGFSEPVLVGPTATLHTLSIHQRKAAGRHDVVIVGGDFVATSKDYITWA